VKNHVETFEANKIITKDMLLVIVLTC